MQCKASRSYKPSFFGKGSPHSLCNISQRLLESSCNYIEQRPKSSTSIIYNIYLLMHNNFAIITRLFITFGLISSKTKESRHVFLLYINSNKLNSLDVQEFILALLFYSSNTIYNTLCICCVLS